MYTKLDKRLFPPPKIGALETKAHEDIADTFGLNMLTLNMGFKF
jgi:hypothetical protein